MAFFRTKERLSDRKVDQDARAQRRQQLQMQQQILDREKAAAAMSAPAEAVLSRNAVHPVHVLP